MWTDARFLAALLGVLTCVAPAQHDAYLMLFGSPGKSSANIDTLNPASSARIAVDNPTTPDYSFRVMPLHTLNNSPAPTTNTSGLLLSMLVDLKKPTTMLQAFMGVEAPQAYVPAGPLTAAKHKSNFSYFAAAHLPAGAAVDSV